MFKNSCQILVYKGERKLPWKNFDNLATPFGARWVIAEPPRARRARERGAPYLGENSKLPVTVRPYVGTDSPGRGK